MNRLAEQRGIDWFRRNVITKVPFPNPGFMRDVYPGFLQLHGFVSMNLDRHIEAHRNLFLHLVKGDGDSAQKHREFYDEYLAVMDLARRVLSADRRDRVRASRPAEGRDDPSRRSRRSREDPPRRAAHGRRRERRHFRRRPDRSGAPRCASTFRPSARRIGCSPPSATTACSTARASAPRSCRASPTSCCRTTATCAAAPASARQWRRGAENQRRRAHAGRAGRHRDRGRVRAAAGPLVQLGRIIRFPPVKCSEAASCRHFLRDSSSGIRAFLITA